MSIWFTIGAVFFVLIFLVFLIGAVKNNRQLKKELKQLEDEKEAKQKQLAKQKEVVKEKEEKKQTLSYGSDDSRFNASVDILSDISKKRKSKSSK